MTKGVGSDIQVMLAGNGSFEPIENQQRSYEVCEQKHYMECTTEFFDGRGFDMAAFPPGAWAYYREMTGGKAGNLLFEGPYGSLLAS
jgi:hypothetical protein